MDISNLFVKLIIALVCAGIANVLVPRRIPGKIVGLILIGLAGVVVGEWGFALLHQQFGLSFAFLYWNIQGVLIVPAILGSAIVLYLVTTVMKWWRYGV
ncbi:MAG: hypothetical protein Kow00121_28300 [Elainellaceae cyanobacterium]